MRDSHFLAGLLAPVVGLGGVLAAIFINRDWWRLTENAISDMGRIGLRYNWVMNASLILAALLGIYYATWRAGKSRNPVEKAGVIIFAVGLVFLAAVGAFPEGTSPHYYVSWAFFTTTSLGMLIAGIGLYLEGQRAFGAATFLLFAVAWALALWAKGHFRGVAVAEFVGVFAIVCWHYAALWRVES